MNATPQLLQQSIAELRRFARATPQVDVCEICSIELHSSHEHLYEISGRKLVCCCQACGILFCDQQDGRYRKVSTRVEFLKDVVVAEADWQALGVPVDLAFIYYSSVEEQFVAVYPGPVGTIVSPVEPDAWAAFTRTYRGLQTLVPDVEAFLIRRRDSSREIFRVPITECHALIGILRTNWEGITGGTEVWLEVERFFDRLKDRVGAS